MSFLNGNISWQGVGISALACATTALATKIVLSSKSSEDKEAKPKEKWLRVGEVKELTIYPIKGCQGVHKDSATVTQLGLRDGVVLRDRVFMVVDAQGVYQVQMKYPKMALISVGFTQDGCITLSAPGMEKITVPLPDNTAENRKLCRIFQEKGLKALDCGDEVACWLQKFLEVDFRLVYHDETKTQRNLSELQKKFHTTSPNDTATFQNYTSYLLIADESIQDLNTHLKDKVEARNFRPSILISGVPEPFSEIRWGVVRIGDVRLKASKPCERCKIVTVTKEGEYHPDGEPLKTLTKLVPDFGDDRTAGLLKNRGIMGLQMGLLDRSDEGKQISVGDPVYVALL